MYIKANQIITHIYKTFVLIFYIYKSGQVPTVSTPISSSGTSRNMPQINVTAEARANLQTSSNTRTIPLELVRRTTVNTSDIQTRMILLKIIKVIYDLLPKKLQSKFKDNMGKFGNGNLSKNEVIGKLNNVIKKFLK